MNRKINQASVYQQESQDTITQIKAISLHQPWASLITMGLKQFETRSWPTNYRGKLVICAAKKNSKQQKSQYETLASELGIDLAQQPWDSLPLGMAIAVCDLTECIEMTTEFIKAQSKAELACGHWEPGRFAWKLENVQPLPQSVPIKGKQGLWNIASDEVEQWLQASDDGDIIVPKIVDIQELSDEDAKERLRLERLVERAFYSAGSALAQLRQLRLYRSTHTTFEDYCQDRFSFTRRHVNYLISAAAVVDNLKMGTICSQNSNAPLMGTIGSQNLEEGEMLTNGWQNLEEGEMGTNCSQNLEEGEMLTNGWQNDYDREDAKELILPTTASQCRPLSALEPHQQVEAWAEALSQSGGKIPPARLVKEVVDKMQQPNKVPNPWREGEVAQIIIKGNPDLKGKGGCWAVIKAVNDFSCSVQLWDGDYQVKPENLKDLPYSNEQQEEIKDLSDRISKLYDPEMEETARAVLASLGKIDRPWLTDIEESILGVLESKMKQ